MQGSTKLRLTSALGLLGGLGLLAFGAANGFAAGEKTRITPEQARITLEQTTFFETKIRPLFIARCYSCHSDKDRQGGIRLDSREFLLKGNAHGPAVVFDDPEKSLLIKAIHYDGPIQMPPAGKLTPLEIAALTAWVKMGAPWPETESKGQGTGNSPSSAGQYTITSTQRAFWSFQPVKRVAPPKVRNLAWCQTPIDHFILARLEARGLKPAPPTDRRSLVRRAYFDLIGLPPTPEEVEAFVADKSPHAFAGVVDHLLASPHYGERWGRHWLDVVRYADSNGLDENLAFANAYRYRDYIVNALNKDKPYDQFVTEQLAGDLLPASDPSLRNERLTATTFLTLGPKVLAEQDKPKMVMDIIDEQIDVTSKAFLGLTVACARCHNHKFDPIPTRDYYALAGIFKSTKTMKDLGFVSHWNERPLTTPELEAQIKLSNAKIKSLQDSVKGAVEKAEIKKAEEALKTAQADAPKIPMAMAVDEGTPEDVRIHIRGSTENLGEVAPRRFLIVIAGEKQPPITQGSGRLQLAQWLTRPDHPLTSRVEVNRIWQNHFGVGLVRTPDNFGLRGEKPSHPELLDWLASEFVRNGWSLKKIHRLIMLSSAYQMSCANDAKALLADPDNRLLWRMNRRRLEAEPFRDAILAVSGKLDPTLGGTLLATPDYGYVTNDQSGNAAQYNAPRRSLYLPIIRNAMFDMFQVFDVGDPSMVNANRATTTIASQALYVLNSPFVLEQSRAFAEGLIAQPGADDSMRVRLAYRKVFGRAALPNEVARALTFVKRYTAALAKSESDVQKQRVRAWQGLCQILFASNEFIYLN